MDDQAKTPVELHSPEYKFPVCVKPIEVKRDVNAYDFAHLMDGEKCEYAFGLDSKKAADVLRSLAAQLDAGDLLLQSGKVVTLAKRDDYPMTFLRIQFHEKRPKAKP